jgi:hypothetical protein
MKSVVRPADDMTYLEVSLNASQPVRRAECEAARATA